MKIGELIRFSRKYLKGRRTAVLMICILPFGAELIFRLAETAVYSLLLYYGKIKPIDILTGISAIQLFAWSIFTLVRWLVCSPLYYAMAVRLSEICHERKTFTPIPSVILGRQSFRRCVCAVILTKTIGFIFSFPVIVSVILSYRFLEKNKLFPAVHSVSGAVFFLFLYISVKISMSAVPFLMAEYRDRNIFRIVFGAFGFLKGRKKILLKIIGVYFVLMLAVVTVPYLFPEFMTAFSLCISIFKREDEYLERNSILRGNRKTRNPRKISHGKKRRFKTASD